MRRLYANGCQSADDGTAIIRSLASPANWLVVLSLLGVCALAALPATGWLIRSHFKVSADVLRELTAPVAGRSLSERAYRVCVDIWNDGHSALANPALANLVRERPGDYQAQLGAALLQPCAGEGPVNIQAQAIRDLESRFPDRPALCAHEIVAIIGQSTTPALDSDWLISGDTSPSAKGLPAGLAPQLVQGRSAGGISRPVQELPPGLMPPPAGGLPPGETPPPAEGGPPVLTYPSWPADVDLAALETAAARGEGMDAGNAFFPMIRAYCLFVEHKDRAAMDAVLRAGQKSRWDSYLHERPRAAIARTERLEGRVPAYRRYVILATGTDHAGADAQISINRLVRPVCRDAVWRAILAEQHGDRETGLRYRTAAMHVASRMRVQGATLSENLCGLNVVRICLTRPGGGPPERWQKGVANAIVYQERLDRYCDYLQRIGHGSDVLWVRTEVDRGTAVEEIANRAVKSDEWTKLLLAALETWYNPLCFLLYVVMIPTMTVIGWALSPLWRRPKRRRAPPPAGPRRFERLMFAWHVLAISLYPVLVLYAAHVDTQQTRIFDRMLTHQGRCMAGLVHREWPGAPDASAARQP